MKYIHDLPSSFYAFIFPTGVIVIALFIGLTGFGLGQDHNLSCDDIDNLLKENLRGNLDMNNDRFQMLVDGKIWCDERAQQSYPDVKEDSI